MAVHNRRETTMRSLDALRGATQFAGLTAKIYVVDDGSSDGTSDAIAQQHKDVKILKGSGSLFWAASMQLAEEAALADSSSNAEMILWLNDDVQLDEDALSRVQDVRSSMSPREAESTCIVGAVRDPRTATVTYSAFVRCGWHPLKFRRVLPGDAVVAVDTFNGNLVAVPTSLARRIGGIDGAFSHSLADIDYGLRVTAIGGRCLLLPNTLGTCPANPSQYRSAKDWAHFRSVKGGGNYHSMRHFVLKHEPHKWPAAYLWSVLAWVARRAMLRQ
jgi:GT2 family glycosyltransferase